MNDHQGRVLLLTGAPGSGKTTIMKKVAAALDEITEEALVLDDGTDIYLVDEIGKMECFSKKFRAATRGLLDSGRPLVATVALRGGGFIAEVKGPRGRRDLGGYEGKSERDARPDLEVARPVVQRTLRAGLRPPPACLVRRAPWLHADGETRLRCEQAKGVEHIAESHMSTTGAARSLTSTRALNGRPFAER